jgi:hypothetical protein
MNCTYMQAKPIRVYSVTQFIYIDHHSVPTNNRYTSTIDVLRAFYHKVVPGGYVVIDDYGHWPQCAKAIHDYLDGELGMDAKRILIQVDNTGYFFQKPIAWPR